MTIALLGDEELAPEGIGCISSVEDAPHLIVAGSALDPPYWSAFNLLLRWDTSVLAPGGYVVDAWLRIEAFDKVDDDHVGLTADWYDWGETCDGADHTNSAPTSALSQAGACGEACDIANIATSFNNDFHLDDPDNFINLDGITGLRLHVGASEMPSGVNGVASLSLDSSSGTPPRLVVLMCGAFTPTPTPPVGCRHLSTAEGQEYPGTDQEWMTVALDYIAPAAPTFEFCTPVVNLSNDEVLEQPEFSIAVASLHDIEAGEFYSLNALLRWDTSMLDLDPNETIVAAWLRTQVYDVYSSGEKHFGGDWYNWATQTATVGPGTPTPTPNADDPCDASDHDPDAPDDALSIIGNCGGQCLLANIAQRAGLPGKGPGRDQVFELDNPNDNISRDGRTYLRLHMSNDPGISMDLLSFARTFPGPTPGVTPRLGPRLDLLVCNPGALPVCGNDDVEAGETCDEGEDNGTIEFGCSTNCRPLFLTPTPTASPQPTPTIPAACTPVVLEPEEEWVTGAQSYVLPPLEFGGCLQNGLYDGTVLAAGSVHWPGAEGFLDYFTLLAWDTSGVVSPGMEVARAWLRLYAAPWSRGRKSLVGDWNTWDPACEAGDVNTDVPLDAMSSQGACGRQCIMKYMPVFYAEARDFELDDPAANVNPAGSTYLRIFGKDETGTDPIINRDLLEIFSSSMNDPNNPESPKGPRLVLLLCPEP